MDVMRGKRGKGINNFIFGGGNTLKIVESKERNCLGVVEILTDNSAKIDTPRIRKLLASRDSPLFHRRTASYNRDSFSLLRR